MNQDETLLDDLLIEKLENDFNDVKRREKEELRLLNDFFLY